MKNKFLDFICDNQAYVVSLEVDFLLERSGFDFNRGNGCLEYVKLVKHGDKIVQISVDSDKRIYTCVATCGSIISRRALVFKEEEDKKITVDLLNSDEFIDKLKESIASVVNFNLRKNLDSVDINKSPV